MSADAGKSTQLKFWIIFGLFIGLLVGLIVYEVRVYMKAKVQRENIEVTKEKVSKMIQKQIENSEKDETVVKPAE